MQEKVEFIDLHIHSEFSHGKNSLEEMIEAAIAKGFTTIGISEHLPRLDNFRYSSEKDLKNPRGFERWEEYLSEVKRLHEKYRNQGIKILLGCEVDWMGEENKNYCAEKIKEGDFDYTIGSVHFLTGEKTGKKIGFDYEADWGGVLCEFHCDVVKIYEAYFAEYVKMVESGLFDIAGHLDLIKIFREISPLPDGVDILKLADKALIAVKKAGMVMEINTAGFAKGLGEFYPSEDILRKACEMGIPITFGSDAHSVERVGEGFTQAMDLARSVGYTEITVFREGGKRESVKI